MVFLQIEIRRSLSFSLISLQNYKWLPWHCLLSVLVCIVCTTYRPFKIQYNLNWISYFICWYVNGFKQSFKLHFFAKQYNMNNEEKTDIYAGYASYLILRAKNIVYFVCLMIHRQVVFFFQFDLSYLESTNYLYLCFLFLNY